MTLYRVRTMVLIYDSVSMMREQVMSEQQKRKFEHVIRERWCKGCNICVAFCPRKVLSLRNGKVFAEHPDDCIGCRLCELRCPDFAIEIREKHIEAPVGKDTADMDFAVSPEAAHD